MRSAAATGLALDVAGGIDANGANVQVYAANGTAAQMVRVLTAADGSRRLLMLGSGKVLDVENGALAAGSDVRQYSGNDTDAQRWDVTDASLSADVDGTKRELWSVTCSADAKLALAAAGTASGSNVALAATDATARQQLWAFVPTATLAEGTYEVVSALDGDVCLDISAGSSANGAQLQVWGRNGTNAQRFWAHVDAKTGAMALECMASGKVLEVDGWSTASQGDRVHQWDADGGTDQAWLVRPDGQTSVNSATTATCTVGNVAAEGRELVLDVAAGQSTPGTYVQLWEANGTAAQRFAFLPATYLATGLPTPTVRGLSTSASAWGSDSVAGNGAPALYPMWTGTGTSWQVRYRYRTRRVGRAEGSWGPWMSAADGSTAYEGWGAAWVPNVTTGSSWAKHGPALSLPAVDNETYDLVTVQVEVRAVEVDYGGRTGLMARGESASATVAVYWRPTVGVTGATWTPDGLALTYASDYRRGGNTLVIDSVTSGGVAYADAGGRETSLPYAGTMTLGKDLMRRVPDDGATLHVAGAFATDVTSVDVSADVRMSWDANHGISVELSYAATDRLTCEVTVDRHATDECWLVTSGASMERCDEVGATATKRTFEVAPPLNEPATVVVVSTGAGGAWGTNSDRIEVDGHAYVWNWVDGHGERRCAEVLMRAGGTPPTMDDTRSATVKELETTGREHPVYRVGRSVSRDLNVSGTVVEGDSAARAHATREDVEALAGERHVLFRSWRGDRAHVAVRSVSMPAERAGRTDVTVKQSEEAL